MYIYFKPRQLKVQKGSPWAIRTMPASTMMIMMTSLAAVKKFCTKLASFTLKQFTKMIITEKKQEIALCKGPYSIL